MWPLLVYFDGHRLILTPKDHGFAEPSARGICEYLFAGPKIKLLHSVEAEVVSPHLSGISKIWTKSTVPSQGGRALNKCLASLTLANSEKASRNREIS